MRSIASKSESLFKDRGSKFYGYATPMNDAEEIKSILANIKEIHPKARHFCYAFRIKLNEEDYFITNDDGEPNNSAGAPILGQIKSFELYNTCIVVVRYFGGTKLGVSGLINAYKNAAKAAIESNQIIEVKNLKTILFQCKYENFGKVLLLLNQNHIQYDIHQDTLVKLRIHIDQESLNSIEEGLSRLGSFR